MTMLRQSAVMSERSRRRRPAPDPTRQLAARLLSRWIQGQGPINRLLVEHESSAQDPRESLEHDERRRVRELLFGCVRLRGRYDHLLRATVHREAKMQAELRAILWVALHELLELSTPDHAAVSQAVELTRSQGLSSASGMVNGVLRRIIREGTEGFFPNREQDPVAHAASWLSHPRWLVERWASGMTSEELLGLCQANNRRPSVVLRTAPGGRDAVLMQLRERGWAAAPSAIALDGIVMETRLPTPLLLEQLPGITIQDEAAQLVAPLLACEGPGRMLDLCAAPGGKSSHLLDLLGEPSRVWAADLSERRMRVLIEGAARIGRRQPLPLVADGGTPPFLGASFDAVLVDAPCTGTGVLARRHDARWARKPEDLVVMPRLQRRLLGSAIDLCRSGGIIVYATCSLEPEENDEVVDAVLAERQDVAEIGVGGRCPETVVDAARLRVWPHRHGCDGAFAAILRKGGENS